MDSTQTEPWEGALNEEERVKAFLLTSAATRLRFAGARGERPRYDGVTML